MAFTQTQLDALVKAYATGAKSVTFGDRSETFADRADLRARIGEVAAALGVDNPLAPASRRVRQVRIYQDGKGL